jgi:hypothetical protein
VENFMQQHLNSIVHLAHTIVLHDRTRVPKAVCEREFSKLAPRVYGGTIKELKEY